MAETLDVYVRDQAAFLIQSNSGTCIVGVQPNNPYQRVIGNNDTGLTFAKGTNWQHLVITNASSGELEVIIYRII